MSSWLISLLLGVGITAWAYNKLARTNGNASPRSNFMIASIGGLVVFFVMFSLLKLAFSF